MFRLIDSVLFALERLWQHRVLVLWALVGLAAATTLALSLPLYVDAVNSSLLTSRLQDPPYAFRFRYLGKATSPPTSIASAVNNTFTAQVVCRWRSVRYVPGVDLRLADGMRSARSAWAFR
jgi:hypothetical protein